MIWSAKENKIRWLQIRFQLFGIIFLFWKLTRSEEHTVPWSFNQTCRGVLLMYLKGSPWKKSGTTTKNPETATLSATILDFKQKAAFCERVLLYIDVRGCVFIASSFEYSIPYVWRLISCSNFKIKRVIFSDLKSLYSHRKRKSMFTVLYK